jgi:hypothetical protein
VRHDLGDRLTAHRQRHALAGAHGLDHTAGLVAKLADADLHATA